MPSSQRPSAPSRHNRRAATKAALLAGKEDEAVSTLAEAQALLLAASDPVGAGRAAHGLGVARLRQDAYFEARVAFEAALTLLREHTGPETVRVLVDLAGLLSVSMGQQTEGVACGQQALELARRLGDTRLEAAAGRVVGNLEVRGNNIMQGARLLERALALAQAADDPAEAAECCACLANAYYWMAEIERSRAYTALREEFARRCQQPYELRHVYSWLAFLAATQGDWDAATRRPHIFRQVLAMSRDRHEAIMQMAEQLWLSGSDSTSRASARTVKGV